MRVEVAVLIRPNESIVVRTTSFEAERGGLR